MCEFVCRSGGGAKNTFHCRAALGLKFIKLVLVTYVNGEGQEFLWTFGKLIKKMHGTRIRSFNPTTELSPIRPAS